MEDRKLNMKILNFQVNHVQSLEHGSYIIWSLRARRARVQKNGFLNMNFKFFTASSEKWRKESKDFTLHAGNKCTMLHVPLFMLCFFLSLVFSFFQR